MSHGTLISEHPIYFQAAYALDRVREKAAEDPSILTSEVLKAAKDGDMEGDMEGVMEGVMAGGMEGLTEIINVSHSGMSVEEFKLDDGLNQAEERGWLLVDMAKDWSRIWTVQE